MPTKLLIVDDSVAVRNALAKHLTEDGAIEVVGMAEDALTAWDLLGVTQPDVVTLDLEMPGMDGLTFLKKVMATRPVPVVVVSSLLRRSEAALREALANGAVRVIEKPHVQYPMERMLYDLREAIAAATRVQPRARGPIVPDGPVSVLAVVAGQGGSGSVEAFLGGLPPDHPPVVVGHPTPTGFLPKFLARLQKACSTDVAVAASGERLRPGTVRIAPPGQDLLVRRIGSKVLYEVAPAASTLSAPNLDRLLVSVGKQLGGAAAGAVLAGSGTQGAEGLLTMRKAGAPTFAESDVSGPGSELPDAARRLGGVVENLGAAQMPRRMVLMLGSQRERMVAGR